jgi:hypothetical protein
MLGLHWYFLRWGQSVIHLLPLVQGPQWPGDGNRDEHAQQITYGDDNPGNSNRETSLGARATTSIGQPLGDSHCHACNVDPDNPTMATVMTTKNHTTRRWRPHGKGIVLSLASTMAYYLGTLSFKLAKRLVKPPPYYACSSRYYLHADLFLLFTAHELSRL